MSGDDMMPVGATAAGGALVLAATGADVLWICLAAVALVVGGAFLVRFGMHRSRGDRHGA